MNHYSKTPTNIIYYLFPFYNFKFSCLLYVVCILACNLGLTIADDAVSGPAVKRLSLRRPTAQGGKPAKPSTTTTTEALQNDGDEGDYQDGEQDNPYADEEDNSEYSSSTTTTTTEAPKRIGPVIRPFRSNDDFLNSLKRRQQNAKKNKCNLRNFFEL